MKHVCGCVEIGMMLLDVDCQCCGNTFWCRNEWCRLEGITVENLMQFHRTDPRQLELPFDYDV